MFRRQKGSERGPEAPPSPSDICRIWAKGAGAWQSGCHPERSEGVRP